MSLLKLINIYARIQNKSIIFILFLNNEQVLIPEKRTNHFASKISKF